MSLFDPWLGMTLYLGQWGSISIQGGCSLRPVKNGGKKISTGVVFRYTFYNVFTHRRTFSFINSEYVCIPMTLPVVTGKWRLYLPKDVVFPQNDKLSKCIFWDEPGYLGN